MRILFLTLLLALGLGACGKSKPATPEAGTPAVEGAAAGAAAKGPDKLVIGKVMEALGDPDPTAAVWANVKPVTVTLIAQPMVAPRPATTTTDKVEVAAVHDGKQVAFLLRWADSEVSEAGKLGTFSDAFALEFPMQDWQKTPVMMGAKGKPVQLLHWRAQYQRDLDKGKPEIKDLYPNANIDMYAMDPKEAPGGTKDQKESFNPGVAQGNPQSFPKDGVDEIIAEGFSTSAVQDGAAARGRAVWKDGAWSLVIRRPLVVEGGSNLTDKAMAAMAFAAWQGGKDEVGSRKSLTMKWLPIELAP